MIMDCPAYMDGGERCGMPAAVEYRYTVESTDGPLESAKIRCPRGHWFNGPIESLTWDRRQPAAAHAQNSGGTVRVVPDGPTRPRPRAGGPGRSAQEIG
jgi:hypothetical protein